MALVAFVPVAVELWYRNVHLILAVLIVAGLRRGCWLFSIGAAIKMTPVLGIISLGARGQSRGVAAAVALGATLLVASVAISPAAWSQFLAVVAGGAGDVGASVLPVPFWPRATLGLVLAVIAGRTRPSVGEPLLVVAIVVANPTLWVSALSMLAAIVPLWRTRRAAPPDGVRSGLELRATGP